MQAAHLVSESQNDLIAKDDERGSWNCNKITARARFPEDRSAYLERTAGCAGQAPLLQALRATMRYLGLTCLSDGRQHFGYKLRFDLCTRDRGGINSVSLRSSERFGGGART